MIQRIGGGAAGLTEPDIERHQSAADVGQRTLEDGVALFVAVEAEMDQCPDEPPALGRAHHDRLGAGHVSGIGDTAVILGRNLQECAESRAAAKPSPRTCGSFAR